MTSVKVKVVNLSPTLKLPEYATPGSDGMDVRACFDAVDDEKKLGPTLYDTNNQSSEVQQTALPTESITLAPGARAVVPTGLKVAIPTGWRISVKPRSGLSLKQGITVLNTPGTIDSDYRGVIGVIVVNMTSEYFTIKHGGRIAQISIEPSYRLEWSHADQLDDTERGDGGYGHSGIK